MAEKTDVEKTGPEGMYINVCTCIHMHIFVYTYCAKSRPAYHIMYTSCTNTQQTYSQTHTAGPKLLKGMVKKADIVKPRLEKAQLIGYYLVTAAAETAAGLLSTGYAATLQVTMAVLNSQYI
jgi:hypothetical protein